MGDRVRTGLIERRSFHLHPGSGSEIRAYLAETIRLDSMRAAEVALIATELVTNAIQHGDADEVEVSVEVKGLSVRVAVGHPSPAPLGEVRKGFGLRIVESLARAWGTEYQDGVLTVWFETRTPGAVSLSPAELDDDELVARIDEDPVFAEELIKRYQPLALSIARRYRGKGIQEDDLDQVALMALLRAIHRYDPSRGALRSFASVTVSGELKRQLRDRGWSVHVPRGLQERSMTVTRSTQDLTQKLGRVPSISEIAEDLGLSSEEVSEAMSVVHGYRALSLDAPTMDSTDSDGGPSLLDMLGELDGTLSGAATRTSLEEAMQSLPERERLIVYLRFYEDMTQSQIAEVVGVSQMQVSRLLARSLSELSDLLSLDV
jgi:RNA polymerase sigma-B factor